VLCLAAQLCGFADLQHDQKFLASIKTNTGAKVKDFDFWKGKVQESEPRALALLDAVTKLLSASTAA